MGSPIRIEGRLANSAVARRYGSGMYVVILVLEQRQGEPITVEWPFGEGAAADIAAHAAARTMPKGTPVEACGNCIQIDKARKTPGLRLLGAVTVIRPIRQPFHEAAAAAA